jgi:YidC/Oxa1 family membrane protein insertase
MTQYLNIHINKSIGVYIAMDLIRYSIIGAIVAVSLVLVNEWTEFKATNNALLNASQPPVENYQNAGELPRIVVTDNNNDTPELNAPAATPSELTSALVSTNLISVKTGTLTITIDPRGGDIVSVLLPKYLAKLDEQKNPFVLLEKNSRRTYIAQSGLIGPNGTDTANGKPLFNTSAQSYDLDGRDSLNVDLTYTDSNGANIIKRFIFSANSYLVKQEYIVENNGSADWTANFYAQLKRDSSEDPAADTTGMGMQPFLGVATRTAEKPYIKTTFSDLSDEPFKADVTNGWISIVQHYFISAWIPPTDVTNAFSTKVNGDGYNFIRYISPAVTVAPGSIETIESRFYAGPKDQESLEAIAPGLELTVDYGWLWWIAQPLFAIMTFIHGYVGNWGWSIIFLTMFVKMLFYPLSAASYRSMAKMRLVTPKMTEIRERHADDKQAQSAAMMELYKTEKVNPLGGCLPILIQMPVFISLYWVLMESVELRHAPWLGWIQDLATMDPYYILPLIMGVSMFIQQKLNPPPPDPMQAKVMQIMPIFFTFFFLWFPAGLVLYWCVNNILSILQQWMITRQIEAAAAK